MSIGQAVKTSRRALVVDDESYLRSFIKDVLASEYSVTEAADGFEALTLLEAAYDVIIVDCMMPRMSGLELVRRIRGNPSQRRTPILMITALDDERALDECRNAGANRILQKPFHPTALLDTLRAFREAERG